MRKGQLGLVGGGVQGRTTAETHVTMSLARKMRCMGTKDTEVCGLGWRMISILLRNAPLEVG
jgi:hypothetical protein